MSLAYSTYHHHNEWTAQRIAELEVMVQAKMSGSQIADEFCRRGFKVSRSAIVGKMWRHNLKSKYLGTGRPKLVERAKLPPRVIKQPKPKLIPSSIPSMAALKNAPAPLRVSLLNLTSIQCRWALDEKDEDGLMLFCGHFAADGRWCPHHQTRCNEGRR